MADDNEKVLDDWWERQKARQGREEETPRDPAPDERASVRRGSPRLRRGIAKMLESDARRGGERRGR